MPARWTDSTFQGDDGVCLYEQRWLPDRPSAVIVVVFHGFAEHSGRYRRHAERLAEQGFTVEAMDLRGHGKSGGRPGYIQSFADLVHDAATFVKRIRDKPGQDHLPLVLFGHSLGATVAGLASLNLQEDIRGLILCSPALAIGEPVWLQRLGLIVSRVLPLLPVKHLDRSLLSTDPRVVKDAEEDPLNFHGFVRVGCASEMVRAGRELLRRGAELRLPLLIIHGTDDRLTLPFASAKLYRKACSGHKSLSLFKGMRHETFNEPDGRHVVDRIIEFIDELTEQSRPD